MSIENTEQFVSVTEVDEPDADTEAIFQRLFRSPAPQFPGHFLAHVHPDSGGPPLLACYVHATDCGDIVLLGGACTDGAVLRRLSAEQQDHLRRIDGIYRYTMAHIKAAMHARFEAMLACCGDARSEQVIRDQGWVDTPHSQLFACWLHGSSDKRRAQMLAKAHSFMPF